VPRAAACRRRGGDNMHSSVESRGRKIRARFIKPISVTCRDIFDDSASSESVVDCKKSCSGLQLVR
jgi:hypothetical protein